MKEKKLSLLLFIIVTFIQSPLYSQGTDSLEQVLSEGRKVVYSNPKQTLSLAQKAADIYMELNDSTGIIESLKLQGIAYDVKGLNNKALDKYQLAMKVATQYKCEFQQASLLCNQGLVYINMGKLKTALEKLLAARQIFEYIAPESNELAHTLNNIGSIYLHIKDPPKALMYFNLALELYEKNQNSLSMSAAMHNIANIYIQQNRKPDAKNVLKETIAIKKKYPDSYGLSISYSRLGALMTEMDSLGEAQNYLQKALTYAKNTNSSNQIIYIYQQKQKLHFKRGFFQKAIMYNRMAYDLAVENNALRHQKSSLKIFSVIYEKLGDYYNAHQYLSRYKQLKESLISQEQMGKIYEMQLDFEIRKKEDEITILKKQQELDKLKIEKQDLLISRKRLQTTLASIALILLFLLFYISYIKYRHKHRLKMELALVNQKKQHTINLLQAEEKERQRIGEELHDGVGQSLSMVKLSISDLIYHAPVNAFAIKEKHKELLSLTDSAFDELRTVSRNLSPATLHQKGLIPAITEIVSKLRQKGNYKINLQVIGFKKPLDPMTETSIYRIIQELTNNIIRHAHAKTISMELVKNLEEIVIIAEDDGIGFDPQKVNRGMGLFNLKTRLDNLCGNMTLDSKPGRGTIVSINIPIKQD